MTSQYLFASQYAYNLVAWCQKPSRCGFWQASTLSIWRHLQKRDLLRYQNAATIWRWHVLARMASPGGLRASTLSIWHVGPHLLSIHGYNLALGCTALRAWGFNSCCLFFLQRRASQIAKVASIVPITQKPQRVTSHQQPQHVLQELLPGPQHGNEFG